MKWLWLLTTPCWLLGLLTCTPALAEERSLTAQLSTELAEGLVSENPVLTPIPVSAASSPQPEPQLSLSIPAIPSVPPISANPLLAQKPPIAEDLQVKFLTPAQGTVVGNPTTSIVLQYRGTTPAKIDLRINGELVDLGQLGRTEVDEQNQTVTQTWYGVVLREGENTLTAQRVGGTSPVTSIKVQVSGTATQIRLRFAETRIPADGRAFANLQGQLVDAQGNPSNRDAVVTLETSAGEFMGVDADLEQPGFQVNATAGQFSAKLKSSTQANIVRVRAQTGTLEAFSQIQFITNLRPSIATGFVNVRLGYRGTDFFGSFRDFVPPDQNNRLGLDARAALFTTGRVGNWLFTGAFNSFRTLNQDAEGRDRLFGDLQLSEQIYPTYGDESTQERVVQSKDSLFVRLERTSPVRGAGTDFFMWGDYSTTEFANRSQEFTAIVRQLHGFKFNYNLRNLQITGFYSNDVEGFQRDTLAPDGTSGFYFLSRRLLLPGSENVFLEMEELNRPGTVVARQALSRGTDYEIDYDRGSLLFRQPVLRTDVAPDGTPLVRRIVITYQYDNQDQNTSIYGGRLRYHLRRTPGRESWLGATYLREDKGNYDVQLYGADALISLWGKGRLIAEYAYSQSTSEFLGPISGSAYRLELEGELARGISGRVYYRSTDVGFSNNATLSFVPGQTRYGAQLTARVGSRTNLRIQFDQENNFGIAPQPLTSLTDILNPGTEPVPGTQQDNRLTTIAAGVQQRIGKGELQIDWIYRDRSDRLVENLQNSTSNQLRSRFSYPLTNKLTLQLLNELNLSGEDPLYPNRALVGVDWTVIPGIKVRLAQQFFSNSEYGFRAITSLDTLAEYKLRENTQLNGRFSVLGWQQDGPLGQGSMGIKQKLPIRPGLGFDFSYEYVFGNFVNQTGGGQQFLQSYAVAQGASSLGLTNGHNFSIGFAYTSNPNFKADARYEFRTSSQGTNSVFVANLTGKLTPDLTALLRYQRAGSSNQLLGALGQTSTLRVGLAYRPLQNDKFNALLRYEYRRNPSSIPESILFASGTDSTDHTFALEAIFAPNWRWEFYGKAALRYSSTTLGEDFTSSTTTALGQFRATYRLSRSWDVAAELRWIGQSTTGYREVGAVAEVGYYLTPNLRLAAGYSFGSVNDRDFNNARSASGPYLGLTFKIDELFAGFGLQHRPKPEQPPSQAQDSSQATQAATAPPSAEAQRLNALATQLNLPPTARRAGYDPLLRSAILATPDLEFRSPVKLLSLAELGLAELFQPAPSAGGQP